MKSLPSFRAILSVFFGLVIGVIVGALVNLATPVTNLVWTFAPICLAAVFSALAGYLLGSRRKDKPARSQAAPPGK